MSKERLEELKKKTTGRDYLWVIEYAVEQSEQAHELENEIDRLNGALHYQLKQENIMSEKNRKMSHENKRYREAMKKIRKLTETDAGTEEQVFIIADDILMDID